MMQTDTTAHSLVLPEYGHYIHKMVAHALTLTDADERQRCAETIVALMGRQMPPQKVATPECQAQLWNQLAYMAGYALEVESPYTIVRHEVFPQTTPTYPKLKIKSKHYGYFIEQIAEVLSTIEDEEEKEMLTNLLISQMRKSLAEWNPDVLSDEKIADDIAQLSQGRVQLDPKMFTPFSRSYAQQNNTMPSKLRKGRKG